MLCTGLSYEVVNWAVYKPKIIKVREKNFFTIHLAPTSDMQFLGMNPWILCTGLSIAGTDFSDFLYWALYWSGTDFVYWALY